jgi:hypothetical protein
MRPTSARAETINKVLSSMQILIATVMRDEERRFYFEL